MIDEITMSRLANLRRQIDEAEQTCGRTLSAMRRANGPALAATTPFLSGCADDLEALAAVVRLAAADAGDPDLGRAA